VTAVATPTADSRIGFELWLPAGWNGRYSQLGNGGFAGNIDQPSLADEIRRGNAAAMTDTGHKGSQFDASWALGHPEKVIDYGYRSIKITTDAAKHLIEQYYGRAPARRYFIGCSNGGRQALVAAQRYPEDWDGVLAGSPPVSWTRQLATFAAIQHRLRSRSENWIPLSKLAAIQRSAAILCGDARSSGTHCRVPTDRLRCHGPENADCLTPAQAATLKLIQSGPKHHGERWTHYRFEPTAAALANNWDQWILNPDHSAPSDLLFATQAYRYLILDRPDWRVEDFDPSRDLERASRRMVGGRPLARVLDADGPELGRFERRGGKLIMYVGWSDAVISPTAGVDYYRSLMHRLGTERVQRFARLFVVPGMQHCQGGIAPNAFGQARIAPAAEPDRHHDVRRALEAWVERGIPPTSVIAAKYSGEQPSHRPIEIRELRPFPKRADPVSVL
jgi:feruloyl esterase